MSSETTAVMFEKIQDNPNSNEDRQEGVEEWTMKYVDASISCKVNGESESLKSKNPIDIVMAEETNGVTKGGTPKEVEKNGEKLETHKKVNEQLCSGCEGTLDKKRHCPICLKYNVKSYFCTQECYKKYWKEHKKIHSDLEANASNVPDQTKVQEETSASVQKKNEQKTSVDIEKAMQIIKKKLSPEIYNPNDTIYWIYDSHLKKFLNFEFTGKMRPWPITKMRTVPNEIEKPDYAISSIPYSEMKIKNKRDIYINSEEEIAKIRAASVLGRKTLDYAHSLVAPGITTEEIDEKVHNFIIANNAYPSTLNYFKFPKSCCTSVNEIVCHGIPDTRPLQKGDIVNIDISVFYNGVHSDLNETIYVGEVEDISPNARNLVETCYFCLMEAIKQCKPGMLYKNIGNIINKYVSKNKYSVVRSYSGHGVGKWFHSNPTIPHYRKNKAIGVMQPGHIFTIEPMINEGNFEDVLWPDNWTSATADGKLSAQFEHTLLVTKTGVEVLTKRLPESPPLKFDTKDHLYFFSKT